MLKSGSTRSAIPSSVRNVRMRSRMYGGVNIFHEGASTWLSTVASAPKRDVPPSVSTIAAPSSSANLAMPKSSPVAASTPNGSYLSSEPCGRHCSGSLTKPVSLKHWARLSQSSASAAWMPRAKASMML
eukprot:2438725-Prymnesium_polylepis.1